MKLEEKFANLNPNFLRANFYQVWRVSEMFYLRFIVKLSSKIQIITSQKSRPTHWNRFWLNFRAYDVNIWKILLFLRGHTMVLFDRGDLIKSTSVSAGYLTGEKACRLSSLHSHIVSKVHHTWWYVITDYMIYIRFVTFYFISFQKF